MRSPICGIALLLVAISQGVGAQVTVASRLCAPDPWGIPCPVYKRDEGRLAAAADSVPSSVQAAERHGRSYRRPTTELRLPTPRDSMPFVGTGDRRCVSADVDGRVRSGEIIAGNFSLYPQIWRTGYGKLWWRPVYALPADTATTLVIRIARLDAPAPARVYEKPVVSLPANTVPPGVISGFVLPTTGTWLLVATIGENWACFTYTLR